MEETVDVLVAGAGPAGLCAVLAAARAGASVLVVDPKSEIGLPVRCAEFVPRLLARELDIPEDAVAQRVEEMLVFAEGKELGRVRSPGFLLNRELLERHLADEAARAGVELRLETRALPGDSGAVSLVGREAADEVRPKIVIAADGPLSVFRSGDEAKHCMPAVQVTLKLPRPMIWTEVHFARRFRLSYAWLFPKGELANVGLACSPSGGRAEMIPLLKAFLGELRRAGKLTDEDPVRRTAGWIPVWGPPETAVAGAVILAGDAAGFTDPLTGAGIWPAIATGELAGKWAARVALEGDVLLLSAYDEDWRGLMGAALARSAAARRKMEKEWDSRELGELVRDVWPGLSPGALP